MLDLDGVMWRGEAAIGGSADAVEQLRAAGHRVGFCTNNSSETLGATVDKLARMGVATGPGDVVTSAQAVAGLVLAGERVLVCGGAGVMEAVSGRRAAGVAADATGDQPDPSERFDAVVVGFDPSFDYSVMARATRAIDRGARLLATNDDPRYPTATGFAPGAGAILASVERASGVRARVAGKPSEIMASAIMAAFGDTGVFVGDSLGTDAAMAAELGWPFGLVLTGNTLPRAVPADVAPGWVASDLAELVRRRLASTDR